MTARVVWIAGVVAAAVSWGCGAGSPGSPARSAPVSASAASNPSESSVEGVRVIVTTGAAPLAEVTVLAGALDSGTPPVPELAVVTDAQGLGFWPLRPGRYEITVSAGGYRPAAKPVTVEAGRIATLDFVIERDQ